MAPAPVVLVNTHIATFELSLWVTLLGAGVPPPAGVATFAPAIFSRTVADDLTLRIGGVGGTVLGTLVVTCFCSQYWLASAAHIVDTDNMTIVNVLNGTVVPGLSAAVVWTLLEQGDIAAAAGLALADTQVATFELVLLTFFVCLLLPADLTGAGKQKGEEH